MRFKEWLQQADWLDGPILEGMLALHRLLVEFFEAEGEPITLEPGLRGYPVTFSGNSRYLNGTTFIEQSFFNNLSIR